MRRTLPLLTALFLLLGTVLPASAGGPNKDNPVRHTGTDYNNGEALPIVKGDNLRGNPPLGPAKIGETRIWLGLDDFNDAILLKNYTLRGVGQKVEVWVANNLNFPAGDCRNDGIRNVITDDQVNYLISEFDDNIYPVEAEWFDTPPNRNGNKAALPKILKGIPGFPTVPQSNYRGEGDNVVVLVDNVRDSNFYDTNNANSLSYIAGFYWSLFDDYFDRTVMSIDAWDWIHRTGPVPDELHSPTPNPCTSAPARPFLYEGVFAHEYQHLLHHYIDPDEVNWVNEGMSDFAEIITEYSDPSLHVDDKGYDSHTQSFLGWLSVPEADWNPIPRSSGPENGLTAWGDQGANNAILSDYGFAYYFMNYVNSQGFDQAFFNAWQHNAGNGIDGLDAALATAGASDTFESLWRDVIVSALVDGYIDNGASVTGANAADLQNSHSEATVYFSPWAYRTPANGVAPNADPGTDPGAPPWGSDYVPLGSSLPLTSVVFNGDDEFVFDGGPEWIVADGYWTNPDVDDIFYDNDQDLSIARQVNVTGAGNLTFEHYYGMELAWDFGFVQYSTDDGTTWTSLPCTGTTSSHDPGAIPPIVANMPGFTGPTGDEHSAATAGTAAAPLIASCDLPDAAGNILLAFRLMTDPAVQQDGWHVRNVMLDGDPVDATPADLSDWDNIQHFDEQALSFYLTLVGINGSVDGFGDVTAGTGVLVIRPTLNADNEVTLTPGEIAALNGYAQVVAIVSGIPASEDSFLYSPYSLMVDGVERADGGL